MPGPKTPTEALAWIQEAVDAGRYVPSVHFYDRLVERAIDIQDVFHAVEHANACVAYDRRGPEHGGTCWRVVGWNVDRDMEVAISVEAFLDKKRRRCILCTVFEPGE
jgi:hypothetical protein